MVGRPAKVVGRPSLHYQYKKFIFSRAPHIDLEMGPRAV